MTVATLLGVFLIPSCYAFVEGLAVKLGGGRKTPEGSEEPGESEESPESDAPGEPEDPEGLQESEGSAQPKHPKQDKQHKKPKPGPDEPHGEPEGGHA
jgi:hypothetical protein